jgi:hypothetical protein
VEPTLFAAELEKFRPYQQRLASSVHHQEIALQEVTSLWKGLKDVAGRGAGARKWEEREKRKKDAVRRFSRTRDGYMEVRDGLAYVLFFVSSFYNCVFLKNDNGLIDQLQKRTSVLHRTNGAHYQTSTKCSFVYL